VALSWIKVFRFIWLDWLLQDRAKKVTRQNGVISYLPFGMLFIKILDFASNLLQLASAN
jgi:hypothetical protein